ncbi:MAG: DUF2437 domain-containing protein, partial [bacterium]|nr:DUF2437 domain-containing protein [bacterium]
MKFLRFEEAGAATLGVLREDGVVSLKSLAAEYPTMMAIVAAGDVALTMIAAHVAAATEVLPLGSVRLLAPIERPGKYLGIGMNYRKHIVEAERLGVAEPKQQFWFNKQTSCIVGPYDDTDPGVTEKLDYEV